MTTTTRTQTASTESEGGACAMASVKVRAKKQVIELCRSGGLTLQVIGNRYVAGCRDFTRTQAIKHWSARAAEPFDCGCDRCKRTVLQIRKRGAEFVAAILAFPEPKKAKRRTA